MTLDELAGKKIAIAGMGENNRFLAEYFKRLKLEFEVVENWSSPDEISDRLANYQVIFRTPGLPLRAAALVKARQAGAQIYSQTRLFFDLCPAKIIGVTGTKGKGTTATLIHQILEAAGLKSFLAGNIGRDPFQFLADLTTDDWVVLELSSFQLQDLHKSPHIAVVLKITPEHLDYHETFEEYVSAKLPIVRFQSQHDWAVVNYDSEAARRFADETRGQILWNSITQQVQGCYVKDDKIVLGQEEIMPISQVQLLGRFNLENVTAAAAAVSAAGIADLKIIKQAVSQFKGLEHRLEFVAETEGVKFYNDSFATTPETAAAALSAFDSPIILIAGGSEKNADYRGLGRAIAENQVKALLAIGLTGPKIAAAARIAGFNGKIYDTGLTDMEKIIAKAGEISAPGDVVLLSPASASFDMFANYKHRGELFKKYVKKAAKAAV